MYYSYPKIVCVGDKKSIGNIEKVGNDGFFVKKENGLYWLCHKRGFKDLEHCIPISKCFYFAFLTEIDFQNKKYTDLLFNVLTKL